MSSPNIVVEWLRSLQLGQYAESFLDNGYDDLEICKQVGEPDLDAIGVFNTNHRNRLLCSVRTLREEGAASVYFTLEESQAIQEEAKEDEIKGSQTPPVARCPFLDEYEEGKVELTRARPVRLVNIIKEKLRLDSINLTAQPYSTSAGERGYLEGLTARYAEAIGCRYSDVLVELEDIREREWAQLSPRFRVLTPKPPNNPPTLNNESCGVQPLQQQQHGSLTRQAGLVTSLSQPIYVPGKYSPSSCLSDREEDEIYGFTGYPPHQNSTAIYGSVSGGAGGGGGGRATPTARLPPHPINKHNYQNWLSPRSAYFYEFPPSERPSKKKTTLIRLLRHLKTSRKDKNTNRANHRVLTPEEGSCSSPLDYDKMRLLQKVTRTNTFEETIHRLKVQEAMKKKERIDRDHEEPNFRQFLRDIRAGVLVGTSGTRCDDTYMYDEDSARLGQHWYDEPPYESDPEDFLMSETPPSTGGVAAHSSRLCFTMGTRGEAVGVESEVISLRSAGDISLPHQRTLLVPGPSSSTVTTRTTCRGNRESGDYAASDVNSVCSRLSSLSMETSRSEHLEMEVYHRLRPYNGVENTISPGHSSDYAEHEELMALQQHLKQCAASTSQRLRTNKCQESGGGGASGSGKTMGRKHHHHHHHHHHHVHHRHRAHHSSAESLPSASSTQALVSNTDDYSPQGMAAPLLARALIDSSPNLYDKEALKFKKGDIIEVLGRNSNGIGRGQVHNRVGNFRFATVELLNEPSRSSSQCSDPRRSSNSGGSYGHPRTLEQMLHAIHMEEHMSLFVLNGYEDLESFCEIREEDLDYLGLTDPEHRAKILAAVQVLQEFEQEEWNGSEAGSLIEHGKEANNLSQQTTSNQSPKDDKSGSDDARPSFLPNIPLSSSDEPPPLPAPESNTNSPLVSSTSTCGGVVVVVGGGGGGIKGGGGSEKSSDSGVSTSSSSAGGGGGGGGGSRTGSTFGGVGHNNQQQATVIASATSGGVSPSVAVRTTSSRGRPPPPPSYVNQIAPSGGTAASTAVTSAGTPD